MSRYVRPPLQRRRGTTCCDDRIHEPYRAPLIADYDRLRSASLDAGAAAFLISGSGAAMLAIADGDAAADAVAAAASAEMPELWLRICRASERGTTVIATSEEDHR